jgi:hypothetical protein
MGRRPERAAAVSPPEEEDVRKRVLTVGAAVIALTAMLTGPSAAVMSETKVTTVPGVAGLYTLTGGDVAAVAWDRCGGGTCFFQYADGNGANPVGKMWVVPSCGRHNVPGDFSDLASSVWNRSGAVVAIFRDANQGGYLGPVPPWWRGNLHPDHDDRMGSVDSICF